MKRCSTCKHWYQSAADKAAAMNNGQCRAMPPQNSYQWPRTRSDEFCSMHTPRGSVAEQIEFGTGESPASPTGDAEHRAEQGAGAEQAAPTLPRKAGPRLRQRI